MVALEEVILPHKFHLEMKVQVVMMTSVLSRGRARRKTSGNLGNELSQLPLMMEIICLAMTQMHLMPILNPEPRSGDVQNGFQTSAKLISNLITAIRKLTSSFEFILKR